MTSHIHPNSGGPIPFEYERRYFPKIEQLPFTPDSFPVSEIRQGYLAGAHGVRIRDEFLNGKHTYTQTIKTGEGVSRLEDEHEISEADFESMWKEIECSLEKNRYFINHEGIDIQLNIFHGKLEGFIQIEVEFDTEEKALAFKAPSWFGLEVTDDKTHSNYSLAKKGKPI